LSERSIRAWLRMREPPMSPSIVRNSAVSRGADHGSGSACRLGLHPRCP
jgi:hypothetical protein